MRRKWASCSTGGNPNFNSELLNLDPRARGLRYRPRNCCIARFQTTGNYGRAGCGRTSETMSVLPIDCVSRRARCEFRSTCHRQVFPTQKSRVCVSRDTHRWSGTKFTVLSLRTSPTAPSRLLPAGRRMRPIRCPRESGRNNADHPIRHLYTSLQQ